MRRGAPEDDVLDGMPRDEARSRCVQEPPGLGHDVPEARSFFISLTMPVSSKPYTDKRLFPFFEGLIPEGWLLDIASKNWKINPNDRMGLLLACCQNCIGAVSVQPIQNENE